MYTNAGDVCVLILYPANLQKSLMSSSSFLLTSLGFSMYSVTSFANRDSFTSLFPVWIPFLFLLCHVGLNKTKMLMVRVGNLFLFQTLEEILSAFHH